MLDLCLMRTWSRCPHGQPCLVLIHIVCTGLFSFMCLSLAKCVDKYTEFQTSSAKKSSSDGSSAPDLACDARLAGVIDRLFELCIAGKKYHEAIGIALETHRFDVVKKCITLAVSIRLLIEVECA